MDNLHLHVIAVVLYFNLPGSVGTKSQWILPATHHRSECRWDGHFLLNCSFTRISAIPEDLSQTAVTADLSYNNIKTFVCCDGRNEEWMLKHLNLSNNLISELTLTTCTNLPILETLNLSGNAIHTLTLDMPSPAHGCKKYSIVDRLLPALKVLSLERNNLNTVPRGNGVSWWTPKGRISKNHSLPDMTLDKMNNLVIYNAEKTAGGLYLCLFNTTKEKYLIYDIEVKEGVSAFLVRKARDTNTVFRQKETESNFALAVSLSVLITFVCAFCLGAFARPYLERLWRLMCRNKNSGPEHTYSNQAFSDETLSGEPGSGVHSPNPKAQYQKQSKTEMNVKKIPMSSKVRPSIDDNESTNIYDTELFFGRTDYQNSNEIIPKSKVRNNSDLLQSEITKMRPDSPERKGIASHNEPRHAKKFTQGRQNCEKQLGLNSNKNIPSDVGDFISSSSSRRYADNENLSIYETIGNSPLTEHDYKRIHSHEKDASADIFGDSSSSEGIPFTMSDSSSLADFELEQSDVCDNLPVCQSLPDEANTDSGTEKFATPPESPIITAELQETGKNEDENSAYFETSINYGSDTTTRETASPYTDKCSGHVRVSYPDTVSSSSQEIPDTFDYFANAESTVQNSISDSLHNQSTDFGNTVFKLKHFPPYDTEKTSEEDELQLSLLPREPQHSLSFTHTEQKENAPAESTDEHTARNSPEKNHGEADITLRNMSASEDNGFIFAPTDTGLNEVVKKPSLLHSSKESSLQLLSEHTGEKHFMFVTQQDHFLPQEKQACADKMQEGSDEKNSDEFTELQDTNNCNLPEEMQSCNPTPVLLHLHSSGKTQSEFTTDDCFQLNQSDEDADSFSIPQGFFSESTPYSSCSFPQKPIGNTISESTDSSKMKDHTTLTELENHSATTVEHLQNSSENLSKKSQTNSGQNPFFVKKKRAFDGFANILQSQRTNFSS
ncbi:leucine-rich repeat-containing protein 66 isoform 2-T2 [Acridotheres tristis]